MSSFVFLQSAKKAPDAPCDLAGCLIKRKVTGFEEVNFGTWDIVAVGRCAGDREGRVVLSPHHQQRRLSLAQPCLPLGIGRDISPVIQEQSGLNVCLTGTRQKSDLIDT